MGNSRLLKSEFDKDNQTKIMKRILVISAGIAGVLAGMALVMPAVARYRHIGAMTCDEIVLFLLGSVLTLGGGSTAFFGAKKRGA